MKKYYIVFLVTASVALLLGSFSLFYALVMKPYQEERDLKNIQNQKEKQLSSCLENAQEEYVKKQDEINKKIELLIKEKKEIQPDIEEEVREIWADVPDDPKRENKNYTLLPNQTWEEWRDNYEYPARSKQNELEFPIRKIDSEIENRETDLKIIKWELKADENYCHKMHK